MSTTTEAFNYNEYKVDIEDRSRYSLESTVLISELEHLVFQVSTIEQNPNYSSESLSSFTKTILRNIGNALLRLTSVHKKFIGIFKALSFTELYDYIAKYKLNYHAVTNLSYFDLMEVAIPVPKGMSGTYLDTLTKNTDTLRALDMKDRIKEYHKSCLEVLSSLGDEKQKSIIHAFYPQDSSITKIEKTFNDYDKLMKGNNQTNKKFSSVFLSNDEYQSFISKLEGSQTFLYEAHDVAVTLDKCNHVIDDIIDKIQHSPDDFISKEELATLSSGCLLFAKLIDMYGVTSKDLLSIDHNFVEFVKQVYKTHVK